MTWCNAEDLHTATAALQLFPHWIITSLRPKQQPPFCYWQRTSITAPMGQLLALLLPNTSFCFSSTEHIKGTHNIYLITATYPSVLEVSHTCKYSMFLESQEANQGYTHIQDTCVFCVSYTHLFTSQNKQLITQPQNTFFHLYCLLTNRMCPPVPPRL